METSGDSQNEFRINLEKSRKPENVCGDFVLVFIPNILYHNLLIAAILMKN